MTPTHPLSWVPAGQEKYFFIVLLALCFVGIAGMGVADNHLRTEVTPLGIVSFQFVGNSAEAGRALSAWGEEGRVYAAFSLGLDYFSSQRMLYCAHFWLDWWVGKQRAGYLSLRHCRRGSPGHLF